ncbi:glycoside hydrolase family 3 protein [Nonomuraea soli]|uniref:Beta-N-acetylhexosaminidase n=1 Tax=Nonomuraea soli TaxID=1032476 RepID=A0A7W0CJN6_9ACTN|nr:glycoside hydrolase family 3 N-terminal domain-containing protein [Nonomuraea soli]MBA2892393.1 beta-N-acetylhexosaminidase [Nonomuraea soli]
MLSQLALSVLQPGFDGTSAPDWLRRALGQGLGGAVLFARNLPRRELVDELRAENADVVVAIDEEGGVVTRLEAVAGSSFPGNRALGVADSLDLTRRVGHAIGSLVGSHDITLNYAPSADVNANPANPVIGVRSFGPTAELVARHTAAWIEGHQSAGVAACAKHFPGHGDTVTDSHLALPTVHASAELFHERDLPPFRAAIEAGVKAIMCGHLLIPALDPSGPATLSRAILTDLLRGELGFEGMLVTDAIEMKAVAALHSPGEIAVRALAAGCDAICVGQTTEQGLAEIVEAVVAAVRDGSLPEERLAEASARVAAVAAWYGKGARATEAALHAATGSPGAAHGRAATGPGSPDLAVGLEAARAALTVTGAARLTAPPHVLEINPRLNLAVGPGTPTGLTAALTERLPGTTRVRVAMGDDLPPLPEGPVVLVVHDAARHPWVRQALAGLTAARPDAIVVETGIPDTPVGASYLETHGISRASAIAAAEWLAEPTTQADAHTTGETA